MENLVIISKVKAFIKEKQGLSTSQSFFEPLNKDITNQIDMAIEQAQKMKRKTVMGRDFSFYKENAKPDAALVVASKVKKYIKEKNAMSTSAQVIDQLSVRVERLCLNAIKNTVESKRKTVLDRDYQDSLTQE